MENQMSNKSQTGQAMEKKMIMLGGISFAAALFLTYLGLLFSYFGNWAFVFFFFSLPLWGAGIAFLVIGIIKTINNKRQ